MIAELERVLPGYAHDDVFLDLVCGLRSASARFDGLLARVAPPDAPQSPGEVDAPEIVELLLGMIAVRDRIALVTAVPTRTSVTVSPVAATLEGSLLR